MSGNQWGRGQGLDHGGKNEDVGSHRGNKGLLRAIRVMEVHRIAETQPGQDGE